MCVDFFCIVRVINDFFLNKFVFSFFFIIIFGRFLWYTRVYYMCAAAAGLLYICMCRLVFLTNYIRSAVTLLRDSRAIEAHLLCEQNVGL